MVDCIKIPTMIEELVSCNSIEGEAGTNGMQGGDSGHCSKTYFRIKNEASTDMRYTVEPSGNGDECKEVTIMFGGDRQEMGIDHL